MASGTCGENLTWILDNKGTLTISGYGDMENWNPYPLKTNPPWDTYRESIKKVFIAEGVTSIGGWAFCGCENLKSVKIPESVSSIEWYAFVDCKSLKTVTIPNAVRVIEGAFCGCTSLKSITIPSNVFWIRGEAFAGCTALKSVIIPEKVRSVDGHVFNGCTSLKKIYYKAGSGFGYNLSYGNDAQLIQYDTVPPVVKPKTKSVSKPKPAPQAAVESLRWKVEGINLTVGGVNKIKDYSEEVPPWNDYLRDVQRVIVEDGVTEIAAHAFRNCVALEHVTIPASLETIGDGAFTFSYCGEWNVNNRKNIIWSLERGTLIIKKNPNAANETDFSIGDIAWKDIEKNIQAVRIERGIVPGKNFFDWLGRMGDGVAVSF